MKMEVNDKIVLTRLGRSSFIFNVEDYLKLRKEHRIIGAIIGTNCVNFRIVDGL